MTFRKTCQWFAVLVLLGGISAGGYLASLWERSDELLRAEVLAVLHEMFPDWDVRIGRARYDWNRRVRIYDTEIRAAGRPQPIVVVPEIVLTVDRERLAERQQVVVHKVRVLDPVVDLVRDDTGRWNWQDLLPLPHSEISLPEWEIEQAVVQVRLAQPDGAPPVVLPLKQADLRLIPSGKRQFLVKGDVQLGQSGTLGLDGRWDVDAELWSLDGTVKELATGGELVTLATGASPAVRRHLARMSAALDAVNPAAVADPFLEHPPGFSTAESSVPAAPLTLSDLGATALLDVHFRLTRDDPGRPATAKVLVAVRQGQLTHPALPFPLHDVTGEIYWDGHQVLVRNATARNGVTRITLAGRLDRRPEGMPGRFTLQMSNVVLDERLRSRLPVSWRSLYDAVRPSGQISLRCQIAGGQEAGGRGQEAGNSGGAHPPRPPLIKGGSEEKGTGSVVPRGRLVDNSPATVPVPFSSPVRRGSPDPADDATAGLQPPGRPTVGPVVRSGDRTTTGGVGPVIRSGDQTTTGGWSISGLHLTAQGCTVAAAAFPYPITGIVGSIAQRERELHLELEGLAGRRPVTVRGVVRDPAPDAEMALHLHVEQLPVDDTLIAAAPPAMQQTLQSMRLRGLLDVDCRLVRPAGADRRPRLQVAARLANGSVEYRLFPYRMSQLSGSVTFDSEENVWRFRELKAQHGTAELQGSASFAMRESPGRLQLTIAATDVQLDKQLELALPDDVRSLWSNLSPSGRMNLVAKVGWSPGQPLELALPLVEVFDAELLIKSFPYPLDGVRASLAYEKGYLEIKSFSARHDDTRLKLTGFAELSPEGDWRLRIEEGFADDLIADRLFRRALPRELHAILDRIDPQGPLSISGMLDFRGSGGPDNRLTAAWDVRLVVPGGALSAGVELKNIRGEVTSRGLWDGERADLWGDLDLDSVEVLRHQFTQVRGPYRLHENRLLLGSAEALNPARPAVELEPVPLNERITARSVGGLFTLDAAITLQEEPGYRARLTMSDGRLEEYAARYLSGAANLRGVMVGWIDLHGRGPSQQQIEGRGKIQISPAALYELPVLVQIFKVLSFVPPDKTAFHYAFADFELRDGQVAFEAIDLVGDAMRLRGRGTAGFDGRLSLDFYSMLPPRSGLAALPVINLVVGEATKGWVGVEVRGTTTTPIAKVKPAKGLDDALKRFLSTFEPPPSGNVPRLTIPGLPPSATPRR